MLSVQKTGYVMGAFLGGFHFVWALLVATGVAQPFMDWIFWLHHIKPVYQIEAFELLKAVTLVIVTGLIGFVYGSAFAWIWNKLHK